MIELHEVSKRFGRTQAVDRLSLAAQAGEIFGLLGPNGAGKSTTIRLMLSFYLPDGGHITFDGEPISHAIRERIGYLPEERGLYPKEKLRDVLIYLAQLKGTDKRTARERVGRWLDYFGLGDRAESKVGELSKGMSHKAQFIAAVAHDPDIVILDEPFSGLDPVSVELLRETVLELRDSGKTVFFSTHVMDQAERLCNRLAIMDRGSLVLSGSMSEVKEQHGSRSVQIEFDGDARVLEDRPEVSDVIRYPRYAEMTLRPEASAQGLLVALAPELRISRFEVLAPSLHRIFLDKVGRGGESPDDASSGDAGRPPGDRSRSSEANVRPGEAPRGETPSGAEASAGGSRPAGDPAGKEAHR